MLHATGLSYVWWAVVVIGCLAVTWRAVPQTVEVAADVATVPGVVIDHVPAAIRLPAESADGRWSRL